MIYVVGMVGLEKYVKFISGMVVVVWIVMEGGVLIFCDVCMVFEGVICLCLFVDNEVICILYVDGIYEFVKKIGNICLVVVFEYWCDCLGGVIVVIGNVLMVFFYLLNMFEDLICLCFVVIIGCFVGFIGVVEFKDVFWND